MTPNQIQSKSPNKNLSIDYMRSSFNGSLIMHSLTVIMLSRLLQRKKFACHMMMLCGFIFAGCASPQVKIERSSKGSTTNNTRIILDPTKVTTDPDSCRLSVTWKAAYHPDIIELSTIDIKRKGIEKNFLRHIIINNTIIKPYKDNYFMFRLSIEQFRSIAMAEHATLVGKEGWVEHFGTQTTSPLSKQLGVFYDLVVTEMPEAVKYWNEFGRANFESRLNRRLYYPYSTPRYYQRYYRRY
jgi:hypothetical protein